MGHRILVYMTRSIWGYFRKFTLGLDELRLQYDR